MRQLRYLMYLLLLMPLSATSLSAQQAIQVRVLDPSETEGLAGIVILVRSPQSVLVQAYVTDSEGRAVVKPVNGDICMVTAIDPSALKPCTPR